MSLRALFDRVSTYPLWQVAIELTLIWLVIFGIFRFVRGTRAAGVLRGVFRLLIAIVLAAVALRVFGGDQSFQRLNFLSDRFLAIVAIGLVVVFQPELRRALIRLGEGTFFRSNPSEIAQTVEAIVEAAEYLSKARFGAIMVIERQVGLRGLVEGGTRLDARLSAPLLQTIFYPGSALHDLAVIIQGSRVISAGVQLPLAEAAEMPEATLGSRHRAAVGVTKETDALVVVVSEETGRIRIVERARLSDPLTPEKLTEELRAKLGRPGGNDAAHDTHEHSEHAELGEADRS